MRIGVFIIMAGAAAAPSRMIGEGAETGPDSNDGIVYRLGFQDLSAGIFKTAAAAAEQDVNRAPIRILRALRASGGAGAAPARMPRSAGLAGLPGSLKTLAQSA